MHDGHADEADADDREHEEKHERGRLRHPAAGDMLDPTGPLPLPPDVDEGNDEQPGRRDVGASLDHLALGRDEPVDGVDAEGDERQQHDPEHRAFPHVFLQA